MCDTTRATPWGMKHVMIRALKGPNIEFNRSSSSRASVILVSAIPTNIFEPRKARNDTEKKRTKIKNSSRRYDPSA